MVSTCGVAACGLRVVKFMHAIVLLLVQLPVYICTTSCTTAVYQLGSLIQQWVPLAVVVKQLAKINAASLPLSPADCLSSPWRREFEGEIHMHTPGRSFAICQPFIAITSVGVLQLSECIVLRCVSAFRFLTTNHTTPQSRTDCVGCGGRALADE
ncbi:hypothetical protein EJ06DRAFT_379679 [Trichodelitschia bisporula]|uniref:Uncharacterized protein n=1 Tax=Trichodelitschia bisporula TaxID=703511 RepID=A0A6G1HYM3_9PEZI|nr:hypothetical protein EJ06DRAFT_379679 [Trichodelitschia bisporula]